MITRMSWSIVPFVAIVAILATSHLTGAVESTPGQEELIKITSSSHHPQPHLNDTIGTCSFNGFDGVCRSPSRCHGTSIVSPSQCGAGTQCCILQSTMEPGCGTAAIERASLWVNMQLLYCQSPNGQPDADPDCSSPCIRSSNPEWDPYRSDCSAFVSWAYGIEAPGRDTDGFAPFVNDTSFVIDYTDLTPGDVINSVPAEHIMIFSRWLDNTYTSAELLEEPGCSASPPYARVTQSPVNITSDGWIYVAQNNMTFVPIRFYSNEPTC